jgi:hypothetical protein
MDLDPFHSLRSVDVRKLEHLDKESRDRFLLMLETVEEPDWRDSLTLLFSHLKTLDESLSQYDEEGAVMPISSVRKLVNRILTDSEAAGDAFTFLEHNRRVMDIIALEQLMTPDSN